MEEKEKIEEKIEEKTGRSSILDDYRASYPDEANEPDDAKLYDFAHKRHSDLQGKYEGLSGANNGIAELIGKDPRFGAFLSEIAGENPKSVPYAFASVFGKGAMGLEGGDLEDFEAGYKEYTEKQAQSESEQREASENFKKSLSNLFEFIKKNNLDEEAGGKLYEGIMNLGESFLMGIVPDEVFDLVYKGLNYEKDVQEAADTGFVEGKGEVVEAKMKQKTEKNPVPNLNGVSKGGTEKQAKISPVKKKGSFYDAFKEDN
jgi:hypothetical protein